MIAEKAKGSSHFLNIKDRISWWRLLLSLVLSGLGLWLLTREVSLAEIRQALRQAHLGYLLLAGLVILITMWAKAWRWQMLFHPRQEAPAFSPLFWALSLGMLVNTAVPFLRLGEVARVYNLGEQTSSSKTKALGTLVVEKVLDMLMLALTLFLLLPSLVLPTEPVVGNTVIPAYVADTGTVTAILAFVAFIGLFVLAYQTTLVLRLARVILGWLPTPLGDRLLSLVTAGLEGLAALRSARATLLLLASSTLIALLSVLTPFVLFPAFNLPLGIVAAAAIHVVLTIGTLPPSTPAKVGVFEFLVVFMLTKVLGVENEAVALAYAVLFHLIVVLPQILLGGVAVARGNRPGAGA